MEIWLMRSFFKTIISLIFVFFFCSSFSSVEAYDPLDPQGNITIKWDIIQWTGDGYVVSCRCNSIQLPEVPTHPVTRVETELGMGKEGSDMVNEGGQATEQGDCSKFKGDIPHCCLRKPTIVDLMPGTPYNQQISNCCRGGVLSSWVQDPPTSISSFQVSVGVSGNTNKTVRIPNNYTLGVPGYTCGPAKKVRATKYISSDGRRRTQAMMTWNVTCTYSQFMSSRTPVCCVSLSSFYNDTIVSCPTCSCGCHSNITKPGSCVEADSPYLPSVVSKSIQNTKDLSPLVRCTSHMCPIRVHWHVKLNYRGYWRVKVSITNFNYRKNYTNWNLVIQHPAFDNLTQLFSFNYKPLSPYSSINDTAMLWGVKFYNDVLMHAGPDGNVQSELLFQKDSSTFTFDKGWAFPRKIYFNGDNCVMPPPESYPYSPNSSPPPKSSESLLTLALAFALGLVILLDHH